ncbi:hypothetical protein TBLA_0E02120 [Henningerozyma blattae CBS 6284]|uniref:GOLD domain-containing protein n=1 Tax=Henningerozyma blattae (strain ATCC 34711 / CBS 6284 / DSM 70876 / NBRC 10599 / NRRL Y-10934 / UCD 77-7) TaxID=1071380 RepID=I2H4G3_HENB6|nr:hypothetical protein TBLA_0E02120 [Tetrapisispora blattae CBS 6284]CCH61265.1 hypothetical protein TBLA_0E02120 [Tetrapisispora blattae CBS 6284]
MSWIIQLSLFLLYSLNISFATILNSPQVPVDLTLPAFSKECIYYDVTDPNAILEVRYQVLYGGNFEIDCEVFSPTNSKIIDEKQSKFGEYVLTNYGLGSYQFCLSNSYGTASKKVEFLIGIKEDTELGLENNPNDMEDALAQNSLNEIQRSLEKIRKMNDYLRAREWRNLYTVESTKSRLTWYSITIISLMITISIVQSLIIQFFFKRGQRY